MYVNTLRFISFAYKRAHDLQPCSKCSAQGRKVVAKPLVEVPLRCTRDAFSPSGLTLLSSSTWTTS